jgi:hypothetical protein
VSWSGARHPPPGKHITKMSSKNCQFCGETMRENAYHCNHCNRDQKSETFLISRYIGLFIVRHSAIVLSVITPLIVFFFLANAAIVSGYLAYASIVIIGAAIFYSYIGKALLFLIPNFLIRHLDLSIPYLLERVEICRLKAIRNWIIFPILSLIMVWGIFKLPGNKPTKAGFTEYAKANIQANPKIEVFYSCPMFDVYKISNEDDLRGLYFGIAKNYISVIPIELSKLSKVKP